MKWDGMIMKTGAAAIVGAMLLRLAAGPVGAGVLDWMGTPGFGATLLFLGTGRIPVFSRSVSETVPEEPGETTADLEPAEVETVPVFSPEDVPEIRATCNYTVDPEPMLYATLGWDLMIAEPTVLIFHTHTTEGYRETENYRSMEEKENMVAVGDVLAQCLTETGICVIHDRTIHDYPSYNGSYDASRKTVESYLESYPSLTLVLDIHRDAAEDSQGNQLPLTAESGVAKLMLVVGTDAGGYYHPLWRENLTVAVKLHARLEQIQPGICRPISLRASRFNQDLSPGMLIVEVGAAGNSIEEAKAAARILGQGIRDLARGC